MVALYLIFLFLLGLIFGSFTNAWEWRLFKGVSIAKGRSMCRGCKSTIAGRDLIPVISFFILKRRCRSCHEKISWQYPLVEFWLGLAFLFVGYVHLPVDMAMFPTLIRDLCIIFVLTFLFIYDYKYQELPDIITLPAIGLMTLGTLVFGWQSWHDLLIGIVIGGGVFLLQYVLSKGTWVGGGDIRLGALMGAILGYPVILVALFLAYILGSLVAIPLVISKKNTLKSQIAFGTFLSVATLVAMVWGQQIINWYLGFLTV